MEYKVFIDGKAGTTGLEIEDMLSMRDDIEIINIQEEKRKDIAERLRMIDEADISFLCLPDAAAIEIADRLPADAKVIDTSTAHRTAADWVYGLPEIGLRKEIAGANKVANPGCHATGFILGVKPLVEKGVVSADYPFAAASVTGFSGGGKKMIQAYRSGERPAAYGSPGQYALGQMHKHLPEMTAATGIAAPPAFMPIVADYYRGMVVSTPICGGPGLEKIKQTLADYYEGEKVVDVMDEVPADGWIYGGRMAGRNDVEIYVHGNDDRTVVSVCLDNLGKGASGAAMQNMNIMLGIEEVKGL